LGCKIGRLLIRESYRGVDYVLEIEEGIMTYDEAAFAILRMRSEQKFLIDQAAIAFGDTDANS
jgi:hypothetical protein